MNGEVLNIAVYARDITDQKKMEKFLRNAREELEAQVDERTEELKYANRKLTKEIAIRKSIETKLRTSEEKYRDLFQNANDLIWIGDKRGNLLSVNNHLKSFSGFSKKELLSINPLTLIQTEDRFRMMRTYLKVLHNISSDIEINIITKSSQIRPIWLKMRPIIKKNQIVGVHGIGRDISDLKRAQAELQASEEQKRESLRQFTLRLAHEIKNPLASIKSSAQLVAASVNGSNPQINRHMDIINRNVNTCNKVIQDLYSYTHLNGYHFEEQSCEIFIQNLNTYLREKMDENPGLKITLKSDRNLPLIFIDQYNLSQAIRNIINNAIEAVSGSGTIAIRVINDKSAKTITFECKDDGIGIPPEDLPLIFQPFYSSKSKGFGIGLSFAKETIENHHGSITVKSTFKHGSTFKVILPTIH
jgi:PAS domain S-box-containing protein